MPTRPRLFVISGPSGAGKGTLIARVRAAYPELALTVSATTRKKRPAEREGISYYFMSDEEFSQRVEAGEFLEWAWVHGQRYGTLKREVDAQLAQGHSLVLELDVQGAFNVRKHYPDAVLIFIKPPSEEVLERRLRGRGTEDASALERRLADAHRELEAAADYDVVMVNDDLDTSTKELLTILHSYEREPKEV